MGNRGWSSLPLSIHSGHMANSTASSKTAEIYFLHLRGWRSGMQAWAGPVSPEASLLAVWTPALRSLAPSSFCVSLSQCLLLLLEARRGPTHPEGPHFAVITSEGWSLNTVTVL